MKKLAGDRVALNPIQWINLKADPSDPASESLWLFAEPSFRADYPDVLKAVRASGFEAVMMQVLDTQTLQNYRRMVEDAGLTLAPGYASVALPDDHGVVLRPGSAEGVRWFDGIRRIAEESNFFSLDTVFLAPEVWWGEHVVRTQRQVAVGAGFDQGRLNRVIDLLGTAAEVLIEEGIRAGLHNHVGTWIETEAEIEQALSDIPASLLGASFDIGHLAWAGIDPVAMISRHQDRLVDLHLKDLDLTIARKTLITPTSYNDATDEGIFLEPGLGDLDLDGVIDALPDEWAGWMIVEVDRASMPPAASADVSWKWVSERIEPLPERTPTPDPNGLVTESGRAGGAPARLPDSAQTA
ncbi:sugar phosphate isomerase/epimerase [Subtercola sp. PAMC28395]|uniref:sugar phosphate isomerase/epimerase family protein n=1 Tax=Subtercola sp. PAMC28395 TaxID=2846775 RepID=UPI001C0DF99C|nr:sugar phosphate isomerase/epimerase [Subtercola sp. PAMC28395]QWT23954.1 sugar phosphate isomerase/epimerase [Subtercola sp. PAMC28395]